MPLPTICCKSALSKSNLPGLMYTFNPYVGCQHGCLYCYVADVLKNRNMSLTWGQKVQVKEDILKLLKKNLHRNPRGVVGVSTVTDPYQPVEMILEVTRQALRILHDSKFPVSVQTKSSLVVRDLDIIKGDLFDVGMTITSLNDEFRKQFERGASPPDDRIQALEEISSKCIATWIFYGPIIPGFNDSSADIEGIACLAEKTKSKVLYDKLNIKPFMRERIKKEISTEQINDMKNYSFNETFRKIENIFKKHGVLCEPAF